MVSGRAEEVCLNGLEDTAEKGVIFWVRLVMLVNSWAILDPGLSSFLAGLDSFLAKEF